MLTSKDITCKVLGTNAECDGLLITIKNLLVEIKESNDGQGFIVDVFNDGTGDLIGTVPVWNDDLLQPQAYAPGTDEFNLLLNVCNMLNIRSSIKFKVEDRTTNGGKYTTIIGIKNGLGVAVSPKTQRAILSGGSLPDLIDYILEKEMASL